LDFGVCEAEGASKRWIAERFSGVGQGGTDGSIHGGLWPWHRFVSPFLRVFGRMGWAGITGKNELALWFVGLTVALTDGGLFHFFKEFVDGGLGFAFLLIDFEALAGDFLFLFIVHLGGAIAAQVFDGFAAARDGILVGSAVALKASNGFVVLLGPKEWIRLGRKDLRFDE
jgi:hypothetical protein